MKLPDWLSSLSNRSDLLFFPEEGQVEVHDEYIVVRSPKNPGYHWGNYLIFRDAPKPGQLNRWMQIFQSEFQTLPDVRHRSFTWNLGEASPEATSEFVAAGFESTRICCLSTNALVAPSKFNSSVEVRKVQSPEEWAEVIRLQVESRDPIYSFEEYSRFKNRQFEIYKTLSARGEGAWWAAYLGGRPVADLGLFRQGDVGRYQSVGTHPDFRRQGICQTLVHSVGTRALKENFVNRLVIVADADYHATSIYTSVGFTLFETTGSLARQPQ
jgi:GNAT superfamily N-acetyltransferase